MFLSWRLCCCCYFSSGRLFSFFLLAFVRNFHFTFFFLFMPFVLCILNHFLFVLFFRQRPSIWDGKVRSSLQRIVKRERESGNNLNYYDDDILLLIKSIVRCGDNDINLTENVDRRSSHKIACCVCLVRPPHKWPSQRHMNANAQRIDLMNRKAI